MVKVALEYVWQDPKQQFRTKVKFVDVNVSSTESAEKKATEWNFDGSSTGQAEGHNSEIMIKPFLTLCSPFNEDDLDKYYVFCECFNADGTPAKGNTRRQAVDYFERDEVKAAEPMFGLEQEFFVFKEGKPLVWSDTPAPQAEYYCGVGYKSIGEGRDFLESVSRVLNQKDLKLNITGTNFEVAPGQMEIQLFEEGLKGADNLVVLRYFLEIEAESHGYDIDLTPKPTFLSGSEWNGSGCHTNFSTEAMRSTKNSGSKLSAVYAMANTIQNLKDGHLVDVQKLGSDNNKLRLTGENETSSMETFSYGVAHRGASVRVPRQCVKNLKGYIEDRRPGSDMDPYVVLPLVCQAGITKNPDQAAVDQIALNILHVHLGEYLER